MDIKKLSKKLRKRLSSLSQYLKDQSFYAKEIWNSSKRSFKMALSFSVLGCFVVLCSLAAEQLRKDYIESKVGSQVLMIKSPEGAAIRGSGTGFEIQAPSGKVYTLTNGHVCELGKDGVIMVEDSPNSDRYIPRRILESYEKNDLCLVEGLEGYAGLKLADGVDLQETVIAVGYPLGRSQDIQQGMTKNYGKVTIALEEIMPKDCTGHRRELMTISFWGLPMQICTVKQEALETNVLIYPGNSGSPLVNVYGNVVGAIFASNGETNWGIAVPMSFIKDFLKPY